MKTILPRCWRKLAVLMLLYRLGSAGYVNVIYRELCGAESVPGKNLRKENPEIDTCISATRHALSELYHLGIVGRKKETIVVEQDGEKKTKKAYRYWLTHRGRAWLNAFLAQFRE